MNLLLDTHVLLWAAGTLERLPDEARGLIENPETEPFFSVVSLWKVAVKNGLGRGSTSTRACCAGVCSRTVTRNWT